MSGFAGFVNYNENYLQDMDRITGCLWKMAEALGAGTEYGIDVVEHNGAFIQNSCVPLSGVDYYRREEGRVRYMFGKGRLGWDKAIRHITCGAFFLPLQQTLYLFRFWGGSPVYYKFLRESTFVFASDPVALCVFEKETAFHVLPPGKACVYDTKGCRIRHSLLPIVNLLR